jgi:hypothetical protein
MYYESANDTQRSLIRQLVAAGSLEFSGAGWVQPDEAITRHEDLIDQLTLGRAFVMQSLGAPPVTTTWIADPFGHSNSNAAMHAAAYSDLLIIGRPMSPLDPFLMQSGAIWYPTSSSPPAAAARGSSILAHEYDLYCDPYRGMRANMDKRAFNESALQLLAYVAEKALRPPFRTEMLIMFGDDGPSESPYSQMYPAIDGLLAAVNALTPATNISVSYSTPSRFVAALAASLQPGPGAPPPAFSQPFPTRPAYDMLPLVGNEFPYWT